MFLGVVFMFLFLLASMKVEGAPTKAAKNTGIQIGGKGPEKPADANVKKIVEKLNTALKTDIGHLSTGHGILLFPEQIDKLDAVSFRELLVSGTLYYVKLRAHEGKKQTYWHATIFEQPWTNTLVVQVVEGPNEEKDPIK